MDRNRKWTVRLTATALAALVLGGAALAAAGDKQDPLVTLSYLNDTATPAIVKQVEEKSAARQTELAAQLDTAIAQYESKMKALIDASGGGNKGGSASYTLVTLTNGQKLALGVGCEVMLRVGTAKVNAATAPGLIDMTTAEELNNGAALVQNHLYLATIADRTVQATAASVKVLVRGSYTVQ